MCTIRKNLINLYVNYETSSSMVTNVILNKLIFKCISSMIKRGHCSRDLYSVELKHPTQDSPNATTAKHFCRSTRIDHLFGEHTS